MKVNKVLISMALASSFIGSYVSAEEVVTPPAAGISGDQGHGRVTFNGSIIDAPCSISPTSQEQIVNLGSINNASLEQGISSALRPFEIKLENCASSTMKTVSVTFSGNADPVVQDALAINGTAKGAAVEMTTADGQPIKLKTATSPVELLQGDNALKFNAQVVPALSKDGKVTAGEFTAVTDFVLKYQ